MRPKHPHAAESGVGKHTARESERVQACAAGKERVTNAHPHKLAPEASKTSGAFLLSRHRARGLDWPKFDYGSQTQADSIPDFTGERGECGANRFPSRTSVGSCEIGLV